MWLGQDSALVRRVKSTDKGKSGMSCGHKRIFVDFWGGKGVSEVPILEVVSTRVRAKDSLEPGSSARESVFTKRAGRKESIRPCQPWEAGSDRILSLADTEHEVTY